MLDILTLCNARYKIICKMICDFGPRHNSAMVANSTWAWNRSFPLVWLIASTRNREAEADSMPTIMNAIAGLSNVRKFSWKEIYRNQPACWKTSGTALFSGFWCKGVRCLPVVRPGPVMELTRRAIPPQKPIAGFRIFSNQNPPLGRITFDIWQTWVARMIIPLPIHVASYED